MAGVNAKAGSAVQVGGVFVPAELRHQQLMKGHEELKHQHKRWEEEKTILEDRLEQAKKQAKKNKRGRKMWSRIRLQRGRIIGIRIRLPVS